jgi:hypothetical protein
MRDRDHRRLTQLLKLIYRLLRLLLLLAALLLRADSQQGHPCTTPELSPNSHLGLGKIKQGVVPSKPLL